MSTQRINSRDHLVGRTMVRADRGGPWRFERGGQAVECICDEVTWMTCQYHAERDISAPRAIPGDASPGTTT
jgi:hypothetical protein